MECSIGENIHVRSKSGPEKHVEVTERAEGFLMNHARCQKDEDCQCHAGTEKIDIPIKSEELRAVIIIALML